MPNPINVLLCFQRPKPGSYIGGVVTLCNDYIDKRYYFDTNGIKLSCFNYELPENGFLGKIKNSKIRNIIYGIKQIRALKKILKVEPDTTIHIHTSRKALFFKDVLLAKSIRKVCKGKILMTIHVGDIATVFYNKTSQKYLINLMNHSVDKVLFLSERMRQQFVEAGLESNRTEILYNFFNIRSLSSIEKYNNSIPHILFLGSINREKGIIELLEALNQIQRDFHLDVCGSIIEESIRSDFERLIAALGNKVTYHGYIGKDKKEELLRQTDILALPSYREGLPISILEAMANSCAIITTPVGAIPEILSDRNAVIVQPRSVEELRKGLSILLTDEQILNKMKVLNYSESQKYTDKMHIDKLCNLYK